MTRALNVYLNRRFTGRLSLAEGKMEFAYADAWLQHPEATPLSRSLPLRAETFDRKTCMGFFGGVLPEAENRKRLALNLGVSAGNDFGLLECIGGECAGAVTFLPADEELPPESSQAYRPLSEEETADLLRRLPERPLLAGEEGVRLSLAGAQDKIALHVIETGAHALPLGGAPSTVILKPDSARFPGLAHNEAFCMNLAAAAGLHVAEARARRFGTQDALVVTRYDRRLVHGNVERIHQEDFCQALAIASEHKYQTEGGPNLKACFALVREYSSRPAQDLLRLLDAVLFNFLIGNHDAHGKNFSLLYPSGETRLAPLYDLVCTAAYPHLCRNMAMRIGEAKRSEEVTAEDLGRMAKETGLSPASVKKRAPETAERLLSVMDRALAATPSGERYAEIIRRRCLSVQENSVGKVGSVPLLTSALPCSPLHSIP